MTDLVLYHVPNRKAEIETDRVTRVLLQKLIYSRIYAVRTEKSFSKIMQIATLLSKIDSFLIDHSQRK